MYESVLYSGRFGSQIANRGSSDSSRVSLSNYKLGYLKKLGKSTPASIGLSSNPVFRLDIWRFVRLLGILSLIYTLTSSVPPFHEGADPQRDGPHGLVTVSPADSANINPQS